MVLMHKESATHMNDTLKEFYIIITFYLTGCILNSAGVLCI